MSRRCPPISGQARTKSPASLPSSASYSNLYFHPPPSSPNPRNLHFFSRLGQCRGGDVRYGRCLPWQRCEWAPCHWRNRRRKSEPCCCGSAAPPWRRIAREASAARYGKSTAVHRGASFLLAPTSLCLKPFQNPSPSFVLGFLYVQGGGGVTDR